MNMIAQKIHAETNSTRSLIVTLLIVSGLALAGSVSTLQNRWTNWDDPGLVLENPLIRRLSFSHVARIFFSLTEHAYLPLRTLSYAVDYRLWGYNPFGFHLTNVVVHTLNCILLFMMLRQALREIKLALAAAALFAVHPVHTEAVAWISGRKDLLAALFMLLALLIYPSTRSPAAGERPRNLLSLIPPPLSFLSAFLCTCACLCKPTAVVLPLLMLLMVGARRTVEGTPLRALFRRSDVVMLLPVLIVSVGLGLVHFLVGWQEGVIKAMSSNETEQAQALALIVLPAMASTRLAFLPVPQCPVYMMKDGWLLPAPPVLVWLGLVGVVIALATRDSKVIIVCGVLWFLIAYLPTSNILPTSLVFAERYLYFPSIGICLCLGSLIVHTSASPRFFLASLRVLSFLLLLVFLGGTWGNNARWRDSLSLWRAAAKVLPESGEVWNDLAAGYSEAGMIGRARGALYLLENIGPMTARLRLNRGLLFMREGKPLEAIKEFLIASRHPELRDEAYYRLAQAFEAAGQIRTAIQHYKNVAGRRAPAAQNNLGVLLERQGDLRAARAAYEKAIALDPGYALAYYNLGNLEQAEKNLYAAQRAYLRAIELNPHNAMAHNNLGSVLLTLGETHKAREQFRRAIELDPGLWQPVLGLAFIQAAEGDRKAALSSLKRVLQLDPQNKMATELHAKLILPY